MGYNTKFSGALKLSRKLTFQEAAVLLEANEDPDCIVGPHPGSYMQWVPCESLDHIVYDGNEKFYEYLPWMEWLLMRLKELGITANGEIRWSGEDVDDIGTILVIDSVMTSTPGNETSRSPSLAPLTLNHLRAMALDAFKAIG